MEKIGIARDMQIRVVRAMGRPYTRRTPIHRQPCRPQASLLQAPGATHGKGSPNLLK